MGANERECRICRDIPDRAEWIPAATEQLVKLGNHEDGLWKCSLCGAYYEYSYAHYPGDGYTCDPYTDESVTRIEPAQAIDWIRRALHELPFEPMPAIEHELEHLLANDPVPEEPTAALIDRLATSTDYHAVGRAAWWLGRRKAEEGIAALAQLLASEAFTTTGIRIYTNSVHAHAARALGSMGAIAAPALIAQLEGNRAAACGLGHLARVDPAAAPMVQRALLAQITALGDSPGTSYPACQEAAAIAWALGMTGYSEPAFDKLVDAFGRDWAWLERDSAIRAISRMGAATVPALIHMLGEGDREVRTALAALTELGPTARPALPALAAHPRAATPDFVRARAAITAPGPDPKTGASRS